MFLKGVGKSGGHMPHNEPCSPKAHNKILIKLYEG